MKCVDWIVESVRVLFYVEVWEQQQSPICCLSTCSALPHVDPARSCAG